MLKPNHKHNISQIIYGYPLRASNIHINKVIEQDQQKLIILLSQRSYCPLCHRTQCWLFLLRLQIENRIYVIEINVELRYI